VLLPIQESALKNYVTADSEIGSNNCVATNQKSVAKTTSLSIQKLTAMVESFMALLWFFVFVFTVNVNYCYLTINETSNI
jgi:hypothetical protein